MEIEKLQDLLNKVNTIIQRDKIQKGERLKRGENFDIIEELEFFTRHEEQLHTPFLRMLLNTKGNHGLKETFLKAFIEDVVCQLKENFKYDVKNSHIDLNDHFIGNIGVDDDGNPIGGEIDIFLHDDNKNAIIIENKFNRYGGSAKDQENQLLRYYNFGNNEYTNFVLIYLTPDGKEASDYSLGKKLNNNDYYRLSYDPRDGYPSIINWLEHCVQLSATFPLIRETIRQYITYLKNKREIMDNVNNEELLKTLLSRNNIETVFDILNQKENIFIRIRQNFCEDLKKLGEKYNLKVMWDDGIIKLEKNKWIIFEGSKQKKYVFAIGFYELPEGVLYGLSTTDKNLKGELGNVDWPENDKPEHEDNLNGEFPYGWSSLYDKNRSTTGSWWNWDLPNSLLDMVNGSMLNFIESRLLLLKEMGVLEKL
ncbi:PDDEXK-like family protein [Xylanibacter oryzae]|uniref:PDDEXK-like family protein n=1 Tax=Xylanibacter oryzae TaxID=185293 RepID=UPI0004BA42FE|nr:PD-(D/E)XK nuclease family protein [Xylanibacter oryzae]